MPATLVTYAVPAALVTFLVYRRIQRTIGFQEFKPNRLLFRTVLFSTFGLLKLYVAFLHPVSLIGDGIGLALGATLAYYAVQHSKFEKRESGWFYRTNPWIEGTVLALLLLRIISRFWMLSNASATPQNPLQEADPFTGGLFFLFVVFNLLYSLDIWRKLRNGDPFGTSSSP